MARPPSVRRNRTQADEKRLFLGGRGLSRPSYRVSGWGNPLAPSPCARAAPAHTSPSGERMGQPACPIPLRAGCARPTLLRAGVWGNLVPPYSRQAPCAGRTPPDANGPGARAARPRRVSAGKMPALPAQVHLSRLCGCAAQHRNENKVVFGRASPSQTLPRAGERGNPVSPPPSPRAYVHVSACGAAAPLPPSPRWGEEPDSRPQRGRAREGAITFVATDGRSNRKVGKPGSLLPCARAAPSQTLLRAGRWGNPVPPYPCARAAPSQPSCGRGDDGGTRFPPTPARGRSPPKPSRERPGFICGTCAARRLRLPTTCQR